jgi:hypothetical protein
VIPVPEQPPADEFMTLWDYVPDPGPMVRDPMWRQIALQELTRPADWTPPVPLIREAAPLPPCARLTALIDDAGVGRRRPRDVAIVEAAIARSLPADVPTFVSAVLSVRRDGEVLVTRVRLFDGGVVVLRVDGGPEPHVRGWDPEGEDRRAFHYVDGAWTRVENACVGEVI